MEYFRLCLVRFLCINATSFYPGKNLGALGDGGIITTNNEVLYEKVKSLRLELDAKKKEGEGAQGVIAGLKSQIESLREELKASQKAFRAKKQIELYPQDSF